MTRHVVGFFSLLFLMASVCSGRTPAHYIEIKLPPGVASETFFARYILTGEDFGGWVQPRSGVSSYLIGTAVNGHPASGIKAILYAPGCAIQTLDLPLKKSENPQYSFTCQPLKTISIAGELIRSDRLSGQDVRLQARYVARWAQPFLGLGNNVATTIPIGDAAYLSADGRFRLAIPDLSQNPPGELQIWAKDRTSDTVVAQLVPTDPPLVKARMGGLKVQTAYPAEIVFAPCAAPDHGFHDQFGFDIRPQPGEREACDH